MTWDDGYNRDNGPGHVSIGETSAHDRYLDPPDEPECEPCSEKAQRIGELEDLIDWIAAHRFFWFATLPGTPVRCALMPYANTDTVVEAKTQREALEKLWREQP